MKYLLILAFSLLFALPIFAQEIPKGTIHPQKVQQVWGLTGEQTPKTAPGASFTDQFGITETCSAWYGKGGCLNISKTDYYIQQILRYFVKK